MTSTLSGTTVVRPGVEEDETKKQALEPAQSRARTQSLASSESRNAPSQLELIIRYGQRGKFGRKYVLLRPDRDTLFRPGENGIFLGLL